VSEPLQSPDFPFDFVTGQVFPEFEHISLGFQLRKVAKTLFNQLKKPLLECDYGVIEAGIALSD